MGGGRDGLPDTKRGGGGGVGSPLQIQYTKSGGGGGGGGNSLQVHYEKWGGGGGQFASGPLQKVGGGGSDVSSPIGVWGKAPEASQAGTHTT